MDKTKFDWILDEDRMIQNYTEFNFSGVLKKLSPYVNSIKEKDDCYLLVLDLPLRAKQNDIKLMRKNKSLIIFIKDEPLNVKNKVSLSSRHHLFFREVSIPLKCSSRLITYHVTDSILLLKIPKTNGFDILRLIKLSGQWLRWKIEQ